MRASRHLGRYRRTFREPAVSASFGDEYDTLMAVTRIASHTGASPRSGDNGGEQGSLQRRCESDLVGRPRRPQHAGCLRTMAGALVSVGRLVTRSRRDRVASRRRNVAGEMLGSKLDSVQTGKRTQCEGPSTLVMVALIRFDGGDGSRIGRNYVEPSRPCAASGRAGCLGAVRSRARIGAHPHHASRPAAQSSRRP